MAVIIISRAFSIIIIIYYLLNISLLTAATMEPIAGTQPKDMMGATPTNMDGQVGAAANQQVHTSTHV